MRRIAITAVLTVLAAVALYPRLAGRCAEALLLSGETPEASATVVSAPVPPVSGGDGALPASGAPQSERGLGWAPSAAVGVLGLSAVLMVAWAVSGRSGRRSHER